MIEKEALSSQSISRFIKPLYNLYYGTNGTKKWKATLQHALLKRDLNIIIDFNSELTICND
jgi:hypothetical protein